MSSVPQWVIQKLRALHANQSGAVAMAVLFAVMISLMMALVIFDATPATRSKLDVQAAADTAAWSQSSVEARTMNMLAFANVGKRIIAGQALFYEMLWAAWIAILAITVAALVIAIIACFFGVGCAFVTVLTNTLINIITVMAQEATDLASFVGEILPRSRDDMVAIDNYQTYFIALTPWWSWGEGWRRGLRNGAYVSGWPVPDNVMPDFSLPMVGSLTSTGLVDALPVERYPNMGELCIRSLFPDLVAHAADYAASILLCGNDCIQDNPSGQTIPRIVLHAAAGLMAMGLYAANCVAAGGFMNTTFTDERHRPFQLSEPPNAESWYLWTSNMVFSYRPGVDTFGERRDKYGFIDRDYETWDWLYHTNGYFGVARSEYTFQDGDPDMWHTSWSTRMRPVALPGEWAAYGGSVRMLTAFNDTVPYLGVSALIGGLLDGATNLGTPDPLDIIKAEVAFDSMTPTYVEGLAR